MADGG